MALHTSLPIYKVAYDLLLLITTSAKNMPRDFKKSIGEKLSNECLEIVVLIFRANVASDKERHLGALLERLQVAELLLRLSCDMRLISKAQYAWWMELAETILFHDPRRDFEYRGDPGAMDLVPPHKRLTNQPVERGLPIGNLSSQFFANVYLDALDQCVKHRLGATHYVRYVDDFVLLNESPQWLNAARQQISTFLTSRLQVRLNPSKTIMQPVARGVDFVGHVIKPWCRSIRGRTFNEAIRRVSTVPPEDLFETANSYFGLMRQMSKSHVARAHMAKILLHRGHAVDMAFSKTYRRSA